MFRPTIPIVCFIVAAQLIFCINVFGQSSSYEPFGIDLARLDPETCNLSSCPDIDAVHDSGAQWVRLSAWWHFLEPNAPDRSQAQPGVYGQWSGLHSYDFSSIDVELQLARERGLKILLVIDWPPVWANGNDDPNCNPLMASPCASGRYSNGYAILNPDDFRDLTYNLAIHCGNQVNAYQIWNEPNAAFEFNIDNLNEDPGNFGNEFSIRYMYPGSDGFRHGNPAATVVAPSLSYNVCTTPQSGCDWFNSWFRPWYWYSSSSFDVLSLNRYPASHSDLRDELDNQVLPLTGGAMPIWVTELGYDYTNGATEQSDNLYYSYIDLLNRSSWYPKFFYHNLRQANANYGLLNLDGSPRPIYYRYQSIAPTPVPYIYLNPNPSTDGTATVFWYFAGSSTVDIYVQSPGQNPVLFAEGGYQGSATAPGWVSSGLAFIAIDHQTGATLGSTTAQ